MNLSALLASGAVLVLASFSQDNPSRVFRVHTSLVNVPAIVSDAQGRYITDLRAEDFALYDDDVQQRISHFGGLDEPLFLALMLDTSQSAGPFIHDIRKAAAVCIDHLQPFDQAMVVSFDSTLRVFARYTSDRAELRAALNRAQTGAEFTTKLRDALQEMIRKYFSIVKGRKAILLFTDGYDAGSSVSTAQLLESLARSDVVIYCVHYTIPGFGTINRTLLPYEVRNGLRRKTPDEDLRQMTALSLGRFFPRGSLSASVHLEPIFAELRKQYLVGFYPEEARLDGGEHRLRLEVPVRPGVRVRHRTSYRIAPGGESQAPAQTIDD